MVMPDVNVLVYSHREDEAIHEAAREWLEDAVSGPSPIALSVLVAVGFLRIVTNPRIFADPTPTAVALAAMHTLVTHANCRVLLPGPRHWTLVARLCSLPQVHGKLVADAQHAAMAIEHGCEWVTRDRDFALFETAGLRWRHFAPTPD